MAIYVVPSEHIQDLLEADLGGGNVKPALEINQYAVRGFMRGGSESTCHFGKSQCKWDFGQICGTQCTAKNHYQKNGIESIYAIRKVMSLKRRQLAKPEPLEAPRLQRNSAA